MFSWSGVRLRWKPFSLCVLSCYSILRLPQVSLSLFGIFRSMCSPFCCQIVAYVSVFSTRLSFSSYLCLYMSVIASAILRLNWTLPLCGENRKRKSLFIIWDGLRKRVGRCLSISTLRGAVKEISPKSLSPAFVGLGISVPGEHTRGLLQHAWDQSIQGVIHCVCVWASHWDALSFRHCLVSLPLTRTFFFIHSLRSAPCKTKPSVYLCSSIWVHEALNISWLCHGLSVLPLGYLRKQIILKGFQYICSHKRSLILNHCFHPCFCIP